jgi:nucleotide-binding universal stress UspA family protein
MAIKDILFLLNPEGEAQPAAPYATALADHLSAHLTAAGVIYEMLVPSGFTGDYPAEIMAGLTEQSRERNAASYAQMCKAGPASLRSELVEIDAIPGEARYELARLARHFDLTIIGQSRERNGDDALMAESALFESGRPVLFVPRTQTRAPKLNRVVVAWDGSRTAARALADAQPILEIASAIDVVSISDPRLGYKELPGFNITRHLSRHGLNAELKRLPMSGDVGETLLSYAADADADLLIMGAYGHSRLREIILGGTTRTIMQSMTVPIFMSH